MSSGSPGNAMNSTPGTDTRPSSTGRVRSEAVQARVSESLVTARRR